MARPPDRTEILRDALSDRNRDSFERALGRAVRRHGGSYQDYLALITALREHARVKDFDLRDAARDLAAQS